MKVTISSLPGAGSSTAARLLAKKLGIRRIDAGDIWDEIAAERGLDVLGLNLAAEKDKSIDVALDEKMVGYARSLDDLLLEARLIGWLCAKNTIPAFKVWVACSMLIRAERIASREHAPIAKIIEETEAREKSEAKRFKIYYDIDIHDLSIYDLVINSETQESDAMTDVIIEKLRAAYPAWH